MLYVGFPILSLIYIIIFLIIYYSKERINLFENKIVSILMITNVIGLILELGCYGVLVFLKIQDSFFGMTILKSYIYYMYVFDWLLTGYIFVLTDKNYDNDNYNSKNVFIKSILIFLPIIIVGFFLSFFTQLNYYNIYPKYYTYGVSTNGLIYITGIIVPIWFFRCIRMLLAEHSKDYNIRISILLLGIILVGVSGALMQFVDRSMLIITSAHSIMLTLIYFTIENPDLKMLREIRKNKELTESSIEDKANLLFNISQDVKSPAKKIEVLSNTILHNNEIIDIQKNIKKINLLAKNISSVINNALDISSMDIKNVEIVETNYNTLNFFNQLILWASERMKPTIDFKYCISSSIPENLYGDSLKLKQVIYSIISNSIDKTKFGNIDLSVSSIIKDDICRLVIEISDTGTEMSVDKINELLDGVEILEEDFKQINELNVGLKVAKKMIDILGGTLIIKSDENYGNLFTIILNQRICSEKAKSNLSNKILPILSNKRRVLLVDDNYKELKMIAKELKYNNFEVITTMYGKDCLDKLKNGMKFEYIFLDDEMKYKNAVEIIEEIDTKKNKVVLMLNSNKESLQEHYLNDYPFNDCLFKRIYKDEIKRIKEK